MREDNKLSDSNYFCSNKIMLLLLIITTSVSSVYKSSINLNCCYCNSVFRCSFFCFRRCLQEYFQNRSGIMYILIWTNMFYAIISTCLVTMKRDIWLRVLVQNRVEELHYISIEALTQRMTNIFFLLLFNKTELKNVSNVSNVTKQYARSIRECLLNSFL